MGFGREAGTFRVDDSSGSFIILFLSVMDFSDDHCLLLAAVTEKPDDNWGSFGLLPYSPSIPVRSICRQQRMCDNVSVHY